MKSLITSLLILAFGSLVAQTSTSVSSGDTTKVDSEKSDPPILTFAEEMPTFPGGQDAFVKYLQQNIRYPDSARFAGKEGTVYVSFDVMKDGKIDSVKLVRGVPGAPELGTEALRVISAMPDWIPGRMNGKAVKIRMTIPISFILQGDEEEPAGKKKRKKGRR